MPDEEHTEAADEAKPEPDEPDESDDFEGPVISGYGIGSAALGALCVAAVALGATIWLSHRSDVDERSYQSRAMQAARDWTGVLINMNAGNVKDSLQRLRDGTVGELNSDFDAAIQPFQQVVQRLQATNRGEVEAVAMETVHRDVDTQPDGHRPPPEQLPDQVASRTDTVMVVATSVSENAGGKPQIVPWNLRLDVSDVDGKLMISRIEWIR